jgi:hypothetical protein
VKRHYETQGMTFEECQALWKKIKREGWYWTCNGLFMPPTEEEFSFKTQGRGDFVMLLYKKPSLVYDIPVMG